MSNEKEKNPIEPEQAEAELRRLGLQDRPSLGGSDFQRAARLLRRQLQRRSRLLNNSGSL